MNLLESVNHVRIDFFWLLMHLMLLLLDKISLLDVSPCSRQTRRILYSLNWLFPLDRARLSLNFSRCWLKGNTFWSDISSWSVQTHALRHWWMIALKNWCNRDNSLWFYNWSTLHQSHPLFNLGLSLRKNSTTFTIWSLPPWLRLWISDEWACSRYICIQTVPWPFACIKFIVKLWWGLAWDWLWISFLQASFAAFTFLLLTLDPYGKMRLWWTN